MCFPSPLIFPILPSPPFWHALGLLLGRGNQPTASLLRSRHAQAKQLLPKLQASPERRVTTSAHHKDEPAIPWSPHGLGRQGDGTLRREDSGGYQIMISPGFLLASPADLSRSTSWSLPDHCLDWPRTWADVGHTRPPSLPRPSRVGCSADQAYLCDP